MPFRFNQLVLTICGRGYSGSGLLVSTSCAQSVMIGADCICHARLLLLPESSMASASRKYRDAPGRAPLGGLSPKSGKVGRAVPSAPLEGTRGDQFERVLNARGALSPARPTLRRHPFGRRAVDTAIGARTWDGSRSGPCSPSIGKVPVSRQRAQKDIDRITLPSTNHVRHLLSVWPFQAT